MPPRKKYCCIAVPTLGTVSIEWASAFRNLAIPPNTGVMELLAKDDKGGEIAEGRNGLVHRALSYENETREVTHIFWIDDDVIFTRLALVQLMSHDCDIASGVYFMKGEPTWPLIFPGRGMGTTPFTPNQVFHSWGHGMGLTLVKMDVYRRMLAECNLPLDKYGRPEWYKTTSILDAQVEDDTIFVGGTEDLYFLDRAGKMGYKPKVDTTRLAFGWHYDRELQIGYPRQQWDQFMSGKPIVWDTSDGPVVWAR